MNAYEKIAKLISLHPFLALAVNHVVTNKGVCPLLEGHGNLKIVSDDCIAEPDLPGFLEELEVFVHNKLSPDTEKEKFLSEIYEN